MAYVPKTFRVDISVTDCVNIRGLRYMLVESNDAQHILREEKSGDQVVVSHREFAELLADGEATIDLDAYVLWQDILLLPPHDGWMSLSPRWPTTDG